MHDDDDGDDDDDVQHHSQSCSSISRVALSARECYFLFFFFRFHSNRREEFGYSRYVVHGYFPIFKKLACV